MKGGDMGWRRVGKERTTDRDKGKGMDRMKTKKKRGRDKWKDRYIEIREKQEMRGVVEMRGKM